MSVKFELICTVSKLYVRTPVCICMISLLLTLILSFSSDLCNNKDIILILRYTVTVTNLIIYIYCIRRYTLRLLMHVCNYIIYVCAVSSESHYSILVRSMPDNYMNTVSQLECHLTGNHIGSILECRDVFTANQNILDCLIEQINTKEGLLDFCNWLSAITDAPALTTALNELKNGL